MSKKFTLQKVDFFLKRPSVGRVCVYLTYARRFLLEIKKTFIWIGWEDVWEAAINERTDTRPIDNERTVGHESNHECGQHREDSITIANWATLVENDSLWRSFRNYLILKIFEVVEITFEWPPFSTQRWGISNRLIFWNRTRIQDRFCLLKQVKAITTTVI